ncbi:Rne/Rng family ribonuclease [Francisella frigiditurris]|uniref:Ribonuclease E n=1 Tax=Francisella frigiditurris TaxID=1542390 RepID=A0A1J0KRM4_9GAMM|nr:Rne/Rng family ribonuclease [Francisella frigiditurris]APC96424.1 ribonuclease, Rne/Rng family domain protein [Francisella frigiditurris]
MKRILINSKSSEETRIATLDNGKLIDLDIESIDREQKKANIYKGYISRIEPSLNAVFVSYGEEKNGFLPFKEISEYYFKDTPNENGDNIASLLTEGQELLVQIDKEERGDKGAALTTFIALAGSYMVLLPNNPDGGGISRRVEGDDRETLKKYLKQLNIPKSMSVIARTACVECSFEELKHDFDNLQELWDSINKAYHKIKKPTLLHKESDIIVRTVRDNLKEDVKEIIVDSKECFEDVKRQLSLLRQNFDINKVKLYDEEIPLFTSFSIDQQIENAYKREIRLPSGGSIAIDTTEALVAVDVNSSRSNKAEDVETTAFKTNLEAAEEVARQLRIRDLGGLIIVDFIDMSFFPNRKQVEEKLMESLQQDKARIQMSRISKLGLVEISRQRLNASINESVMQKCPRCEGHGFIKTTQATALTILRKIRVEAIKEDTNEIRVQVPVDIAAYILNEKRESILEIERISNVKVMIIPNFNMESPKFQMQRIWGSSYKSNKTSSELIEDVFNLEIPKAPKKEVAATNLIKAAEEHSHSVKEKVEQPKVEKIEEKKPEVVATAQKKKGFLSKLSSLIFGKEEEVKSTPKNTQSNNKFEKKDNTNNRNENGNNNNNSQKNDKKQNDNNKTQRDNSEKPFNKNKKNDNFEKSPNNRRNNNGNGNNNNNRSNNISINNAEEVVDITKLKYKEQAKQEEISNVKKVISKNPQEFISVMVKDVLENYDNLKDNSSEKITTIEKSKTEKYLKFDIVSTEELEKSLLAEQNQIVEQAIEENQQQQELVNEIKEEIVETPNNETIIIENDINENVSKEDPQLENKNSEENNKQTNKPANKQKRAKAKQNKEEQKSEAKDDFINYSPAVDFDSQSIL